MLGAGAATGFTEYEYEGGRGRLTLDIKHRTWDAVKIIGFRRVSLAVSVLPTNSSRHAEASEALEFEPFEHPTI